MPTASWTRAVIWAAAAVFVVVVVLSGGTLDPGWSRALGAASALVPAGILGFDRWAWRWPVVRNLHGRPVLQGTWRIEQVSSSPLAPENIEGYLLIRQSYSGISVAAVYPDSRSYSLSAELRCEDHNWVLSYLFRSEAGIIGRADNPPRRGGAILIVSKRPAVHLEGEYWTERATRGQMRSVGHASILYETFGAAQAGVVSGDDA